MWSIDYTSICKCFVQQAGFEKICEVCFELYVNQS